MLDFLIWGSVALVSLWIFHLYLNGRFANGTSTKVMKVSNRKQSTKKKDKGKKKSKNEIQSSEAIPSISRETKASNQPHSQQISELKNKHPEYSATKEQPNVIENKSKIFVLEDNLVKNKLETNPFYAGMRVRARYKQGKEWYPGIITKVAYGGLLSIAYDDGEREAKVPIAFVRPFHENENFGLKNSADKEEEHSSSEDETPLLVNEYEGDWVQAGPKPKKSIAQKEEMRNEISKNEKNRKKRQAKREKELMLREIHRKSL